jgi:hypothetical protein
MGHLDQRQLFFPIDDNEKEPSQEQVLVAYPFIPNQLLFN